MPKEKPRETRQVDSPQKVAPSGAAAPPKKKKKTWLWVLLGCGGCLVILIILAIVGFFVFRSKVTGFFENMNIEGVEDISGGGEYQPVNKKPANDNTSNSNLNAPQNQNTPTNTNGGLRNINLNFGGTNENAENANAEVAPTPLGPSVFESYFVDPSESLIDWKTYDSDGDGVEEGCAISAMTGDDTRAFILDWNDEALRYDLVYERLFPGLMHSIIIKDWDGDGKDDFVLVVTPDSGDGIGLVYNSSTGGYEEIYPEF